MAKRGLLITGLMLVWLNAALAAAAGGQILPFSGRLLDDQARPVSGPVDLQLTFFRSEADASPLPLPPYSFYKIELADGVFHLKIMVGEADLATLSNPTNTVYLQVKEVTHDRVYRRQKFDLPAPEVASPPNAVSPAASMVNNGLTSVSAPMPMPMPPPAPAALPPPAVDLEITRAASAACFGSPGAGAKFLSPYNEAAGPSTCGSVCALSMTGAACIRGWTIFSNNQYIEFGSECSATPVLTAAPVSARLCCCLNLRGPSPLIIPAPTAGR
ncbi:MAG: hypothetical protein NTY08_00815 [Proteobacteria bacterium]|nr:hypothetical protein [Pseudomonadota bacterium]